MVATTDHDAPAGGAGHGGRGALRAWLAGFLAGMRAERQRAVNRRLMQELPDHLLKDMGIGRTEIGTPAAAADMLRNAGGWR